MDIFQKIFSAIEPLLPNGWEEMWYCADYEQDSYSMRFYVRIGDKINQLSQCDGMSQTVVINKAIEIDKFLAPHRNMLSEQNRWNVLTMVVDNTGHFYVEYDYTDITDRYFEYIELWEKKYLKNRFGDEKPNTFED